VQGSGWLTITLIVYACSVSTTIVREIEFVEDT
jgi:hypothetical protein